MAIKEQEPVAVATPQKKGLMGGLFSGVAHKIKIMKVPGELPYWDLQLGDLPKLRVHCGVEAIIPVEYLSVLDATIVDTFRDVPLSFPDPETGNIFRRVPHSHQRSPYQDYGEVSWDEWLKVWAKSGIVKA